MCKQITVSVISAAAPYTSTQKHRGTHTRNTSAAAVPRQWRQAQSSSPTPPWSHTQRRCSPQRRVPTTPRVARGMPSAGSACDLRIRTAGSSAVPLRVGVSIDLCASSSVHIRKQREKTQKHAAAHHAAPPQQPHNSTSEIVHPINTVVCLARTAEAPRAALSQTMYIIICALSAHAHTQQRRVPSRAHRQRHLAPPIGHSTSVVTVSSCPEGAARSKGGKEQRSKQTAAAAAAKRHPRNSV